MDTTYFVAMSLDGYIADADGGVGWLDGLEGEASQESYESFFAGVDGLLMGRATYDFVFEHGSWPYGDTPCWICTSRELQVLDGCNIQRATRLEEALRDAESKGLQHLWVVGGGKLAGSLIEQERLTRIHVSIAPVVLGSGVALLDLPATRVRLRQQQGRVRSGACELVFRVEY